MPDDSRYPFDVPVILDDTVFVEWGGLTGSSTPEMRNFAYLVAEESIAYYTNILPLETTLTGSYSVSDYLKHEKGFFLSWGMVNKIHYVRFIGFKDNVLFELDPLVDRVYIIDPKRGFVYAPCSMLSFQDVARIDVSYDCGLPSGLVDGAYFLALSTYAQEVLNEMMGYGNEAPGMVGVEYFSNQQYMERRKELVRTSLGSSPKSDFVRRLLENDGLIVRRWVGL